MATNTRTGADLVALQDYGVTDGFGTPGTTEMPVVRALHDSEVEYVLVVVQD